MIAEFQNLAIQAFVMDSQFEVKGSLPGLAFMNELEQNPFSLGQKTYHDHPGHKLANEEAAMKGSAITFLSVIAIIGGALHGKMDHDKEMTSKRRKNNNRIAKKKKSQKSSDKFSNKKVILAPKEPDKDVDKGRKLLDEGRFLDAKERFRIAMGRELSAEDYADAQQGLAEVELYKSLMDVIAEHPFADGQDLYSVILPSGSPVTAKILNDPKAERLTLKIRDGRQLTVQRKRLKKLAAINKASFKTQLVKELDFRTAELGRNPNPVEIYRTIVSYCLEYRLRTRAISYLKLALSKPSGSVLIDLFCDGDTRVFHRAQARMAGITDLAMLEQIDARAPVFDEPEPRRSNPGPKAQQSDPEVAKTPDPEPEVEVQPQANPKPRRKKRPNYSNDLRAEPKWQKADAYYRKGITIYRQSLRGSSAFKAKTIKQSRELFEKASELIFELSEVKKYSDEPTLDRRAVEIQQLIYDCIKRQKI
jgi:hypothetical protein